jgi:hypothetical protein
MIEALEIFLVHSDRVNSRCIPQSSRQTPLARDSATNDMINKRLVVMNGRIEREHSRFCL